MAQTKRKPTKVVRPAARKTLKKKQPNRTLGLIMVIAVVVVGIVVARYSGANALTTFEHGPNQMQGGTPSPKSVGTPYRLSSMSAPGVDPIYTLVSAAEMGESFQVCVDYTVTKPNTWLNVTYNVQSANGSVEGLAVSKGATNSSGSHTECVTTANHAQGGTINVNVSPGQAQIFKIYGQRVVPTR